MTEEFDEEESFTFTEEGAKHALLAVKLFEEGKSHVEIAESFGWTGTDEEKTNMVQVLVAIGEMSGIYE